MWYPTSVLATPQQVGPFTFQAALDAPVAPGRHPLVLVSHGTGSHELGHAWLGQSLSAAGYIVAALRHAGDDYEDRSAMVRTDYFERRPRQVSALLNALLSDPAWSAHIDTSKIAVIGHSAGGYTALALAGGVPDRERVVAHCGPEGIGLRDDAVMCALGRRQEASDGPADPSREAAEGARSAPMGAVQIHGSASSPSNLAPPGPGVRDPRIRAVVAIAPLGVPLAPASLAGLDTPVHIEYGRKDEVLAPKFHAEALCRAMPRATCVVDDAAGHFASFQAATGPLVSDAGDPSRDPAGFDRVGWQTQAQRRIQRFLAQALR